MTCLDIAIDVSVTSQSMCVAPTTVHMEVVYRILYYLEGSPGTRLVFTRRYGFRVEAYMDADWAGSTSDQRSTSRYCTFVEGNLVTW